MRWQPWPLQPPLPHKHGSKSRLLHLAKVGAAAMELLWAVVLVPVLVLVLELELMLELMLVLVLVLVLVRARMVTQALVPVPTRVVRAVMCLGVRLEVHPLALGLISRAARGGMYLQAPQV